MSPRLVQHYHQTSVTASCFQNSLNKISLYYVKNYLSCTGCITQPLCTLPNNKSLFQDKQLLIINALHIISASSHNAATTSRKRTWQVLGKDKTRQEHPPKQTEAVGLGEEFWAWQLNGQQGSIAWGSGGKQCTSSSLWASPQPHRAHIKLSVLGGPAKWTQPASTMVGAQVTQLSLPHLKDQTDEPLAF